MIGSLLINSFWSDHSELASSCRVRVDKVPRSGEGAAKPAWTEAWEAVLGPDLLDLTQESVERAN